MAIQRGGQSRWRGMWAALLAGCGLAQAEAQPVPPAQATVVNIGASPLKAPTTTAFIAGPTFTMETWIYPTANTPYAWIMGKGLPNAGIDPYISFALFLDASGTKASFAASTGAAGSYREITAPTALPLRAWTHVAAVLDGATMRLLVNGVAVATGPSAGTPGAATAVALGVGSAFLADGTMNYPPFPGYARQARFWNVVRTPEQIAADAGRALPAETTGLVAAWPLDDGAGAVARDVSGADRALTAPAGALATVRTVVLEAGQFFTVTSTVPAGGVLADVDDGILIDFDSDGDLDLVTTHIHVPPTVPETRERLRAFRNDHGVFTDVTDAVLGNVTMVHPRHRIAADFNADGRMDLLIGGHGTDTMPFPGEQMKLLIQSADGKLVDESATRLPPHNSFTHNLAVADIDGDGDLDIYVANVNGGDSGPRFYLNNGDGFFTEATDRLPADIAARTAGLAYTASLLVDVNGDGFPDLVLGGENTSPVNELLINDGTGHFARDARFTLPPKLFSEKAVTVAITSGDFNADGAPDLVLSTTGGELALADGRTIFGYGVPGVQLLLNRGDGTFYDATARLNLTFGPSDTWVEWVRVADMDGDGRPDLVLQGAPSSSGQAFSRTLLLNRGGATFVDASDAVALGNVTFLAPADVDGDGLMDLVGVGNAIEVARGVKPLVRGVFQAENDNPGPLTNLSVRTTAGSGDQILIAGFVVQGEAQSILVRAIGPTLGSFGVPGVLADPRLELYGSGGLLMENDNWSQGNASADLFARLGAFSLEVTSQDAALVAEVEGPRTAQVSGAAGATGIALAEIYDAGAGVGGALVNVSARAQVGTGADVLIAGFVVSGNVPRKLLIRGMGPSLTPLGVAGALADPELAVRAVNGADAALVAVNDNWKGATVVRSAAQATGAFGFASDTSADAAIAIELPPGVYTATVSGRQQTTGVALVEIYAVP
ncbi:FG-GAP-like repeat-containing protein [Horticoccus luteus]|uniref:FG-GAP-like repeat-containing protein n=1 Tax=Horticoccus luteus TaxID=2862869 RepID=A0A8F9TVA3_9BACT|nr:FG-GAP-like repeat-containing protein [Horticoccus luteus]QYM78636.1 FG-GAP-like repeat-containing protein [Horticoccus luteus]